MKQIVTQYLQDQFAISIAEKVNINNTLEHGRKADRTPDLSHAKRALLPLS